MSMRLNSILKATALGSLLAMVVIRPVHAVDGVIEITQARAFAGGVTLGDGAGFPVTISQPGSYRLTGNLDVTKMQNGQPQASPGNITAIEITAENTTLDLNGFMILGPAVCSGAPPASQTTCSPSGSGKGVFASSANGVTVRNGTIQGMGSTAIDIRGNALVEHVRAINNGDGIFVRGGSIVRECIASSNAGDGISESGLGGIVVTNNITIGNGGSGMNLGGEATVTGNTSSMNYFNGITANAGAAIIGNTARNNRTAALAAGAATGYTNNVFNDNNGGVDPQVNGGTEMPPNICGGDLTCP